MDRPIRPGTRPGGGGEGTRPKPFPGFGDRPSILPGKPGNGDRPSTLPGKPGNGDRPSILPGKPGNGDRPNILPEKPGNGDRPSILPEKPGDGDRPWGNRPDGDRPWWNRPDGDRPWGDRPFRPGGDNNIINIGDINLGNNGIINNRPSWANISNDRYNNIGNRWQNQIGGMHNWVSRYPDRGRYWNNWGNDVRNSWHHHHHHHNWFGPSWWGSHQHHFSGWHYGYSFSRYSYNYWWTVPTFAACTNWFTWQAPTTVWQQPVYYDYGTGGNVVYQDNSVYINGEQVASSDEFAQSAMRLATVAPPETEEEAAEVEWMPLGTFAVSSDVDDKEPTRVIQLAVSQEGIISGTLYNSETEQADSIQGQVDKETQRVAFRIGESEQVVVETGLYNLTLEQAPVLVHFGSERTEDWLLVRLENPDEDEPDGQPSAASPTNL
ncbi:MAG: hypothetical protein P1U77_06895 [Rubripirellula sp.]|nr:hypothetical protein [Rubripirellula sp.]